MSVSSEGSHPATKGREPRGKKRWISAFAIAGFAGPALLTTFGAITGLFHVAPKFPVPVEVLIRGLTKLWFTLFLLQGAHNQGDLVIWWLPCVAANVALYCVIGLVAWWSWHLFIRWPKLSLGVLLAGCISSGMISYSLGWWGRPILWRFPADYRGWVVVQYEDSNCPPLTTKGFYKVIVINAVGRSCTSSQMPTGFRYLRFEYVDPNGAAQVLVSGWYGFLDVRTTQVFTLGVVQNLKRQVLFVGTDQERKQKQQEFPWLTP
jgi:hypothetical protein